MGRQARRDVPRWQRRYYQPAGLSLTRRQNNRMIREAARLAAVRGQQAESAAQGLLAQSGLYRYRYQMAPLWLLLSLVTAGEALHLTRETMPAASSGAAAGAAVVLLTWRRKRFAKRAGAVTGCLIALSLPLLAWLGTFGYAGAALSASVTALAVPWLWHYRIRRHQPPEPDSDQETWRQLAEHKRWHGKLGPAKAIPGGRRFHLQLDGIRTHIGTVTGQPLSIAAAWHKPITEAFVERAPDGDASGGYLTLLDRGTLEEIREWDGQGVTDDGFAKIGRYADAADARIRLFAPMDGARHGLISGTSGAGKSALLELMLHVMLTCGFIFPVVLDPQEGQSLPDWRGRVPYAAGVDECMEMLELLHAGMFCRSRQLRDMTYDHHGHARHMSFFDHERTGWPLVAIIADEMHMVLTGQGKEDSKRAQRAVAMVKDIGKLGRKTGTALWLVTQVPSLEELGSQVLRSMLTGGNIIALRTADKVSGGMLGLPADPHDIPQYFPDGSYTYGLGYIRSPDRRQAIARTDIPSARAHARRYELPALEDSFARTLARFGTAPLPAAPAPAPAPSPLVAVAAPEDDKPGRTAADAVLEVVKGEMSRNDILAAVKALAIGEWGRPQPFAMRSVTTALESLTASGHLARTGHGVYAPPVAALRLAGSKP